MVTTRIYPHTATGVMDMYAELTRGSLIWSDEDSAMVTPDEDDNPDYAVPMPEIGASQKYVLTVPTTLPAGTYDVTVKSGTGDIDDAVIVTSTISWTGTAIVENEAMLTPAQILDLANGIETGITLRQALRLILSANAGKLSGASTTTITIRDATDTKDRITATVDANGNRSAITLDLD